MMEVLDTATLLFGTSLVFIMQICPPPMTPGGAASGGTFDGGVSFFCFCFFPPVMGDVLEYARLILPSKRSLPLFCNARRKNEDLDLGVSPLCFSDVVSRNYLDSCVSNSNSLTLKSEDPGPCQTKE
jgi:hypothetical protein